MKLYIFGFIGGLVALSLAGFVGLIIFVLGAAGLWYYAVQRGVLFIRAYVFLKTLAETDDVGQANRTAFQLGMSDTQIYADKAMNFARNACGGSQLTTIREARARGFRG